MRLTNKRHSQSPPVALALVFFVTCLICPNAFAQSAPINCPPHSLDLSQIAAMLNAGVPDGRLQEFVRKCGVSFSIDVATEIKFAKLGASSQLIALLRVPRPPAPRMVLSIAGKATVTYQLEDIMLGPSGTKQTTLFAVPNRGNVPCSHDPCSPDGKFAATRWSATLSADPGSQLRNPALRCIGQACPWTQVQLAPAVTPGDPNRVTTTVLCWGDTTQWLLEADLFISSVNKRPAEKSFSIAKESLVIEVPANAIEGVVSTVINNQGVSFPLGHSEAGGRIRFVSRSPSASGVVYRYDIRNPKWDSEPNQVMLKTADGFEVWVGGNNHDVIAIKRGAALLVYDAIRDARSGGITSTDVTIGNKLIAVRHGRNSDMATLYGFQFDVGTSGLQVVVCYYPGADGHFEVTARDSEMVFLHGIHRDLHRTICWNHGKFTKSFELPAFGDCTNEVLDSASAARDGDRNQRPFLISVR